MDRVGPLQPVPPVRKPAPGPERKRPRERESQVSHDEPPPEEDDPGRDDSHIDEYA